MEFCDVVDQFGTPTGRVVPRGARLATGEFYLVVHVWITDENVNYLIQQRSTHLASDPGIWATTVGYVLAGEDSLTGAIREVEEELGIQLSPAQLRRFDRHAMENRVEDIWFAQILSNSTSMPALGPEAIDWKWVSKSELEQMASSGNFFRYSYLNDILKQAIT
jgi:8-oxo-dGTP pyrophosphatase MutT (NUDIX family)